MNKNGTTKSFLSFMVNLKIGLDPIYLFRDLENFLLKKLKFRDVRFYNIHFSGKTAFSRRIIIGPKGKNSRGPNVRPLVGELKRKGYILKKNKYWFLIGKEKTNMYLAEAFFPPEFKLNDSFLLPFLKFIQNATATVLNFQKEISLVDVDDVTGLYNQRRLHKDLEFEQLKYKKTMTPFSVLFIDIDHFKSVNDGSGHLVGSQLLSDLADRLKEVLRGSDKFYRYGGDEFVIILPGAKNLDALRIGRRILRKIKEKPFKIRDLKSSFSLSASIGVATLPQHTKNVQGLLKMADKMLYRAKDLGRGRVCSVSEIFGKKKVK